MNHPRHNDIGPTGFRVWNNIEFLRMPKTTPLSALYVQAELAELITQDVVANQSTTPCTSVTIAGSIMPIYQKGLTKYVRLS